MRYTGVDEVGYGALAGPIVAVAITMPVGLPVNQLERFWPLPEVKDSKKTTTAQRKKLCPRLVRFLVEEEAGVGVGIVPAREINEVGYSVAADRARVRAVVGATEETTDLVIVDGDIPLSRPPARQFCVPKADTRYWLVAASSILAKEIRDNTMIKAAAKHPHYAWEKNKGYAGGSVRTSAHVAGLLKHGLTDMHRTQPVKKMLSKAK